MSIDPTLPVSSAPVTAAFRDAFELPEGVLYLDCAAHGPRLRSVQRALIDTVRSALPPAPVSAEFDTAAVEHLRALAARLYDDDADAVAFVPSAAFGLSLAAAQLPLARGEAVLVLEGQFPSNLLCWQQRCDDVGAHVLAVRRSADGWTPAVLHALRDPRVRIAALPQAYWQDGSLLDLDPIADEAHARGIALVLDLSQSLGARSVDFARWRPQFAVSVGHKWALGAFGLAYLWAAPHWRQHGRPLDWGWTSRSDREGWRFEAGRPSDLPGARRFDAGGVLDRLRIAASSAALEQLHAWRLPYVSAALQARVAVLLEALADDERYAAAGAASHFVGLRPQGRAAYAIQRDLAAQGIVCTARHGVLRLAPHLHLDDTDLHAVAQALHRAVRAM